MKRISLLLLLVIVLGIGTEVAMAQKVEVHPYVGGFFPSQWRKDFTLKNGGIYGLKFGVFTSDRLELEGNFGYIPHFEFKGTDPLSRAMVWEFAPSWNIFSGQFDRVSPYLSLGFGGVTSIVGKTDDAFTTDPIDEADISPVLGPRLTIHDGDTFFQVSYGGGIKALNLWGPVGFRGDVRGRSMPNFFGNSVSWLETSGGLTFTWGER